MHKYIYMLVFLSLGVAFVYDMLKFKKEFVYKKIVRLSILAISLIVIVAFIGVLNLFFIDQQVTKASFYCDGFSLAQTCIGEFRDLVDIPH